MTKPTKIIQISEQQNKSRESLRIGRIVLRNKGKGISNCITMRKINSYTKRIGNWQTKVIIIRAKRIKQTINNNKKDLRNNRSIIANNKKLTIIREDNNNNSHNPVMRNSIKDHNRIK